MKKTTEIIITKDHITNGYVNKNVLKYMTDLAKTSNLSVKVEPSSKLKFIPHVEGITTLDCSFCPSVRYIPDIESLTVFDCTNCKGIKRFPYLRNIKKMHFNNSKFSYFFSDTKHYKDTLKIFDKLPRKNIKESCSYMH